MARFSATDSFQHVGDGVALDLSESGCKLCSALVLPIGSFWDLYLTIPETAPPVLISGIRVIWAAENEYGIEFLRVTAREQDPATPFHLEAHEPLQAQRRASLVYPH